MNPLEIYSEYFPHFVPSIYQQEMIENEVTDEVRWRETLEFWAGNDYRPQSIFKILEYYKKLPPTGSWIDIAIAANADKDARLVEIATLQVLMTSDADIQSVNYFRPAIEHLYAGLAKGHELLDRPVSSELIDIILMRRRQQYELHTL